MNCPQCRRSIEDDSRFCRHCGERFEPRRQGPREAVASAARRAAGDGDDGERERNIWRGRPSWRAHCGHWIIAAGLWIVLVVLVYRWTPPDSSLRTWVWAVVGATAVALLVRELLVVFGQRYRLTNIRLFVDRGILTRTTDQTELLRVDDVRIRQGLFDRLVNTGTVEVLGSDTTDEIIVLQSIDRPAEVAESLLRHVRAIRAKQTLFVEHV